MNSLAQDVIRDPELIAKTDRALEEMLSLTGKLSAHMAFEQIKTLRAEINEMQLKITTLEKQANANTETCTKNHRRLETASSAHMILSNRVSSLESKPDKEPTG